MSQALGCAFVAVLASARPPGYGGEIVSYVYGPPLTQDPATAQTAADAAAHSAAFEPLYARQGEAWVPVLASGPPRITSTTVEIPLRTDVVRHDNIAMTPAHVVDALLRLENIPHAAYVLSPLLRREGRPAISVADDEPTVVFELDYPDASFIDLLSADHARLAWPSESGPMVGTGPFRWQSPSELRSFLQHRDGRPYIDNIVWRPYASRFGATALAERGEALIFGGPKPPRVFAGSGAWLVLQIGPTIGDAALRDGLRRHMQSALRRPRITRRYMGPEERAVEGFVRAPSPEPATSVRDVRQLQLLAPRGLRFGHRLVERVQLDLFRSGLQVQTRWVDPDKLSGPRTFDLKLFELRPGVVDDGKPRSQLLRLLSVAAALGVLDRIDKDLLAEFATANIGEQSTRLQAIDLQVRKASGTVVIARTVPAVALPTSWRTDERGRIDWANQPIEVSP